MDREERKGKQDGVEALRVEVGRQRERLLRAAFGGRPEAFGTRLDRAARRMAVVGSMQYELFRLERELAREGAAK